ncbi:HAD family hydrolase [Chrysiogenes arsenatis]|uniref:HAD family hydrolase n=1 Tax=Chrysiogenes arsenatis TaxID=309797 RepID=UPI00048605BE|nr:HAD family hydrolase [Chrysiogenes arsenatis]
MHSHQPHYQAIVFDVDGTLIDSHKVILHSLADTARDLIGRELNEAELQRAMGYPGRETLRHLGYQGDLDAAILYWYAQYQKYEHFMSWYDGVPQILQSLVNTVPLGIVTNNMRFKYETIARQFAFDKFFHFAVCVDETTAPKPAADPLEQVASHFGVPLHATVYIGDSLNDLLCARNAGADFIGAGWGILDPKPFIQHQAKVAADPVALMAFLMGAQP